MKRPDDIGTLKRPNLKSSVALLTIMLKYAFMFFCAGMGLDLIGYIYYGITFLAVINTINLLLLTAIFISFMLKRLSADAAMLFLLSSLVLNLAMSIIHMALQPSTLQTSFYVLLSMGISFVPIVMARLTSRRYFSVIFIAICMGAYFFAAIVIGDKALLFSVPIILLLLIGAAVLSAYTMEMTRRVEREKAKAETEWNNLADMLDLDKQQIAMLKQGKLTQDDIENLMAKMTDSIKELILRNAMIVVHDDQSMANALKRKHPGLTSGELELCCMIVKGYSAGNISRIRGVGVSTITSTRCRLRHKISLPEGESLKSYLESVVNEDLPT